MKSNNYSQGPVYCRGIVRRSLEESLWTIYFLYDYHKKERKKCGIQASKHLAPLRGGWQPVSQLTALNLFSHLYNGNTYLTRPLSELRKHIMCLEVHKSKSSHCGARRSAVSWERGDTGSIPSPAQWVWHGHSCGVGCTCSVDLIPGLGTPCATRQTKKGKKERKEKEKERKQASKQAKKQTREFYKK